MFKKRDPKYSLITVASDMISVAASSLVAYWFRFSGLWLPVRDTPSLAAYAKMLLIIAPVLLYVFRSRRLYSVRSPLSRIDEFFTVIKATSLVFLIFMAITFAYREFSYSRIVIVVTWALSMSTIILARNAIRIVERKEKKVRGLDSRLLIVGINRNARQLIRRFRENPRAGYHVAGVVSRDPRESGKHLEKVPVLGHLEEFDRLIDQHRIQEVILADPALSRERTTELMLKCESRMVQFKLVADFYGLVTTSVDIDYIGNVPLLGLKELPLDDAWNRIQKRSFDAVLSFLGLVVLAPVGSILALAVKSADGGPVFYRQERVGQDGRLFRLIKFRTMKVNAEKETGPVWAREDDQRVTALGRFMRRTNLDELPQLWNVFKGDMSLVGPRPERPHFVRQFRDMIPRYMARHKIRSGITGWAQVNGYRGNTSLKERIKYDLYYMENWSLLLDVKILMMTLFAFKNAY
ncbi:MAG: undecaprenyl-phosphate glucose phosphotransferase [Candidatus Omnitrophica bacterium]|nr:undecaprenyl-phosphate glucose phosphotransferase [Candidatus Omnitrophota bacterium]